jgi:hypothetical protein
VGDLKALPIPNTNPKIDQGGVAEPAIQCAGRGADGFVSRVVLVTILTMRRWNSKVGRFRMVILL